MKKAGIAIDKWKLPIFKKVLNEAEVEFEEGPGMTKDTLLLTVMIPDAEVDRLTNIVAVANNRAAKSKSKRWS